MGFFSKTKQVTKHYKFEKKELGSGNFAKVYKATTIKPGVQESGVTVPQQVAIKVIDKKKVEDLNDITREIEIMETCQHKNIIRLYEIFEEKDKMNLIMELVTGGELFDEIVQRGNFTEKDAAKVIGTLCSALDYLHEKKIVHRDLKPENILLSQKKEDLSPGEEAEIKVADFGLARLIADKDLMRTACGTPGYVAPEVLKNKGYGSGAVDLWSAGVILYILLCGFPPFYEEELPALFDQILKGRYDFPSPWWDNISNEAKELVKGLLTVDQKKRFTAKQVMAHPWICGNAPDTAVNTQQLKKFNASRKLKAAAAKIILLKKKGLGDLVKAAKMQEESQKEE